MRIVSGRQGPRHLFFAIPGNCLAFRDVERVFLVFVISLGFCCFAAGRWFELLDPQLAVLISNKQGRGAWPYKIMLGLFEQTRL